MSESEVASPEESAQQVIETVDDAAEASSGNVSTEEEVQETGEQSDEQLADTVQDESASEEEVQEAKEELARRLSLKINGQEKEFDLSNDDDLSLLRDMAQKGEGADQKFQEAAKVRKQMEAFAKLMQQDPLKALEQAGHDLDKLSESHMQKRIEEMQKSPEQLELEKLRQQIEDEKQLRERLEQEKMDAEQGRLQEEYSRQLDVEITDALGSSSLPKSPYVIKQIAENLMIGLQKDPNVQVSDILPMVEQQIKRDIRQMFEATPEDALEALLGDNVSNKLRKRRLSKIKKTPETAASIKPTGTAEIKAAKAAEDPKPASSAKDFFKGIGSY